jgi:prephenate dehydrogenase
LSQCYDTVTIVGVGLLGGSIGLALRERKLSRRVLGIGRDRQHLQEALDRQIITQVADSLEESVGSSDLVIVCVPVGDIAGWVVRAAAVCPASCVITDVGSTKAHLVRQVDAQLPRISSFVGSHPIAGSHRQGCGAADARLFTGALTVLTPTQASTSESIEAIRDFWQSIGSHAVVMSPEQHDALVAFSSHIPHVVAAALAASTPPDALPLSGTGWRDTTRVASGSVGLWVDILRTNQGPVLQALSRFQEVLNQFQNALTTGDWNQVESLLLQGKELRDALGN